MAPRIQEAPEHAARRRAVRKIDSLVSGIRSDQCDPETLRQMSIEILPFPLSPDGFPTPDGFPMDQPLFFQPFGEPLQEPGMEGLERKYPDYTPSDEWKEGLDEEEEGPDYGITPMDWARHSELYFCSYLSYLKCECPDNSLRFGEHGYYV